MESINNKYDTYKWNIRPCWDPSAGGNGVWIPVA